MKHRHLKVLHAPFAHPVGGNIVANAAETVFRELGVEIERRHVARELALIASSLGPKRAA
jgi:hypothetical protein